MNQRSLLPLEVVSTVPADLGSQDLRQIATTSGGQDWAAKTLTDHPLLPISEYLGYRLGEAAQLGVPYWHVLLMPDQSLAFGSRLEGGVVQWSAIDAVEQAVLLDQAATALSRIAAFDLFYGNDDRHLNNFLFRRNRAQVWTALAFDFSRAGWRSGFPPGPDLPLPSDCNTELLIAWLRQIGKWDAAGAGLTIGSLQAVDAGAVERMIADAPETWLDESHRGALLAWWASPARNARLRRVLTLL
ncbi:MAG: hypothetical protein IT518_20620 [Burkholderiales bacterium]|nr:hypothetical protein [Burkholderiales bacterium]